MLGNVELVTRSVVNGWARDTSRPDEAVRLVVKVDQQVVASVVADAFREDLQKAGIGTGHHSFSLKLSAPLSSGRHVVEVAREDDGIALPGSPRVLEALGPLKGNVELVRRDRVEGWAADGLAADRAVSLLVMVDGKRVARVLANRYRADLEQAGIADGRRSFVVNFPQPLVGAVRHVVEVRREDDQAHLAGSPQVVEPESAFDAQTREWMSRALGDAQSDAAISERLEFLSQHTEKLLELRGALDGRRREREAGREAALRWKATPGRDPASQKRPSGPLRALVIDERVPVGKRDAGSNAILSHMLSLQRLGYEVTFADAQMAAGADERLAGTTVVRAGAPWYASVEELLRRQAGCFDLVYLHRLPIAMHYGALVRRHQPRARLLYSVADLHHLRLRRQATIQRRPELVSLADRMQVAELIAIGSVDTVITHSSHEASLLRRQVPAAKVHVVPWAVPAAATRAPFETRRGMAFIGHYGHPPNVDAARWLIDEIVPRVREQEPAFECELVGTAMPADLRVNSPGIVVRGEVDDLSSVFDRMRLTIAPLTFGAGVKGKVLDSLAAGVPCVCTTVAAEGLDLPPSLAAFTGDTTDALVAAILRLHADADANRRAAQAGLDYVGERLSEPRVDALIRAATGLAAPKEHAS